MGAVDVVVSTYLDVEERQSYLASSVDGLISNLIHDDKLRLVLADDSETVHPEVTIPVLADATNRWDQPALYSRSSHNGIGASLNRALELTGSSAEGGAASSAWMYTTDDWLLTSELDLKGPTKLLDKLGYDIVRLGPIHPDLCCTTRFQASIGWWLDLLPHYGGFAFATRPFIATKAFYDKIGPFDERLNSYETERLYAERVARSTCKLAYWGGVDLAGPWEHLGVVDVGYREIEG